MYNCSGREDSLSDCVATGLEQCVLPQCSHAYDAGVVCIPGERYHGINVRGFHGFYTNRENLSTKISDSRLR